MSPAATTQVAPGQEAGRPQPQTTVMPAGHPFVSYAHHGWRLQYQSTGNAFGGQINNPLVAVPGYIKGFSIRCAATGGSATAAITAAGDAPYNCFSNIQLYDAFGTPLIIAPGYEALSSSRSTRGSTSSGPRTTRATCPRGPPSPLPRARRQATSPSSPIYRSSS